MTSGAPANDIGPVVVADQDAEHALGRSCARGFESLGLEVVYVDTRTRSVPILPIELGVSTVRSQFVETVREVDPAIVFVITGSGLSRPTLTEARSHTDAVFCNWNPDNPFMARSRERRMESYIETLSSYDIAFIWTKALFDRLQRAGAREVAHLPFAYDPTIHRPLEPSPAFDSDIVFAGHWSEKRQRHLAALADLNVDLAIYGNYWKRKCYDRRVRRCVRDNAVFGDDYARALSSATIALNIVADHNLDAYNMRSFEIPATGSFMATSRTSGQEEIFGEGEGMVCFDTPEELRATITAYLESEDREKIARVGAERVEPHTYEARMRRVIEAAQELR